MRPEARPTEEEVPCGWGLERDQTGDGRGSVQRPLEEALHPEEGDQIPETPVHVTHRLYLYAVFDSRRDRLPPLAAVHSDLLTSLGLRGVRSVSPDVAVFTDLATAPDPEAGTFHP